MRSRAVFVASVFLVACNPVPSPRDTAATPATDPETPTTAAGGQGTPLADAAVATAPPPDLGTRGGGAQPPDLGDARADLGAASTDLGATPQPPRHPWTVEQSGTTADLYAIWGSSANDVYVVGAGGTILHSKGAGDWTREDAGTSAYLRAIWGSGQNDVHVVGAAGGDGVRNGVHLERRAGGAWAPAPSPSTTNPFTAIWGSSAQEFFLATEQDGNAATISRTSDGGVSWTTVPMTWPNAWVGVNGIWGGADGVLWASGIISPDSPDYNPCGTRWRSSDDGLSWSVDHIDGIGNNPYGCVWGEPSWTQPLTCMAHPIFDAYDPATQTSVSEGGFYGVWGIGSDLFELTGAGSAADIVYSDSNGSSWTVDYRGAVGWELHAIWGTALDHLYVVGDGGLILRRD